MEALISQIQKYIAVNEELKQELKANFEELTLLKKECFIREGQYNVSLAFIQSGIFRCFNLKEEKEITNDFFFENTFLTDYGSFLNGLPAKQHFEAIEDTRIFKISREKLFKLSEQFPELRVWGAKMAEVLFTQSLTKESIFRAESPEERYIRILNERPEIIQRVPLHYIASYLGITQVHLSRIRNKRP